LRFLRGFGIAYRMLDRRRLLVRATACLGLAAFAGATAADELAYPSEVLGRSLPCLVHPVGAPGPGAPLIYLLHGHGGNEWDWVRLGVAIEATREMVEAGSLPPLHLVMPGVGNSWYVDAPGPKGAAMATALLDGLMPAVEALLDADRTRLGIIGLSMGGFGALHLGLQRPERFRFIGALSPSLSPPGSPISDRQLKVFAGAFGDPFDNGRYAAANPFGRIAACAAAAARPFVYLACGEDDELGFAAGTRSLGQALAEAGVPTAVRVGPGHHDWAFWRGELPHALAAFSAWATTA
jgi:S-formylglutathione hydrolase FrmB